MIQGIFCGVVAVLLLPYIVFGAKLVLKIIGALLAAVLGYAAYKGITTDATEGATATVNDGPVSINYGAIAVLVLIVVAVICVARIVSRNDDAPGDE